MAKAKDKASKGMVDISEKDITKRTSLASAQIAMSAKAFKSLMDGDSPKGNVLETAKVAGVMAAKSTPSIIPMCHPLALNKVNISFDYHMKESSIVIICEVVCLGRTGVEMEALMAVSASALTIYDMMKWADKSMVISDIKLLKKTGGKSGDYHRT